MIYIKIGLIPFFSRACGKKALIQEVRVPEGRGKKRNITRAQSPYQPATSASSQSTRLGTRGEAEEEVQVDCVCV